MSSRHATQWKTRNTLYLRISASSVLQMIIYLDPTHTAWMSDAVLERVLETLRDRIRLKLIKESNMAKGKGTVDVYRGAGWQMAFYLRRTAQKHAVLLKDKQVVIESEERPPQGAGPSTAHDVDADVDVKLEGDVAGDRPLNGNSGSLHDPLTLDDEDEKQLKPKLKVAYAGFAIYGRTLVVVVEPYPRLTEEQIRASSVTPAREVRELSQTPSGRRPRAESSMMPPPTRRRTSQTPLFRAETPSSSVGEDDEDDDADMSGFRSRSQSIARTFGLDDNADEQSRVGGDESEGEIPER